MPKWHILGWLFLNLYKGMWLRTKVKGNHKSKYTLLNFVCHKGIKQSLQTLEWLRGTRLYAELSHFSPLLNIVMYHGALSPASKWTSFTPFRFIYYAVRCYLKKKILWKKWLIYLHRPAFVLTGFICLCQCKLTETFSQRGKIYRQDIYSQNYSMLQTWIPYTV